MKHVKKMRLVECTEDNQNHHQQQLPNIHTYGVKDEEVSVPHTLQNLDKEMENILDDTTTDINEKWVLYHQVLQRYLGFIKRMRHDERAPPSPNLHDESEKDPSSSEAFNKSRRFSAVSGVNRPTSTPRPDSSESVSLSKLPIRIRKRILHKQQKLIRRLEQRTSSLRSMTSPNDSATVDDDDDDDDLYEDTLDDDDGKALTTASNTVVNGWTESNIKK